MLIAVIHKNRIKMKTGYIYKFQNKINGKCYIGQTTRPINERVRQHLDEAHKHNKFYFHNALNKYGIENFEISILHTVDGRDKQDLINQLNVLEMKEIEKHNSFHNGYNSTTGGYQGVMSDAVREKISKGLKGKSKSKEHIEKVRQAHLGSKRSEQARLNISKGNIGKKHHTGPHSEETKRKISESAKKRMTLEMRQQISNKLKGRKHTPEAMEKIIEANKRINSNPQVRKKLSESVKRSWIKRKEQMMLKKQNNNIVLEQKIGGI